jgi:3-oxoadipate enol-lactonase
MGGVIGMWLGVHAPERLNRLVLCNTAARIGTNEMWNARIATARTEGMNPIAASVIERWFTPEFRASAPDQVAKARRMLETASPTGYSGCCAALRDIDLRDAISKIAVPALIIYGAKDPVTSGTDAQFIAERVAGSVTFELDAAHLSNIEQAALFTETIGTFLSR